MLMPDVMLMLTRQGRRLRHLEQLERRNQRTDMNHQHGEQAKPDAKCRELLTRHCCSLIKSDLPFKRVVGSWHVGQAPPLRHEAAIRLRKQALLHTKFAAPKPNKNPLSDYFCQFYRGACTLRLPRNNFAP